MRKWKKPTSNTNRTAKPPAVLSELDRKILSLLEEGGYQKKSVLSSILGVSERTVSRRIDSMKSRGLIKIIAIPNLMLLGYKAWAKIGIKVAPGTLFDVARELVLHPSVYFVAYALGDFDIMIAVRFHTIDGLAYFTNFELTRIKGIMRSETMLLIGPRKYYDFNWPAFKYEMKDSSLEYYLLQDAYTKSYEVNGVDEKILSVLQEDALIRPAAIRTRLGVGEATIRRRLKEMSSKNVFKIVVVPNMELLEYETWASIGISVNDPSVNKVLDSIIKLPSVYLAALALGKYNIVLGTKFRNVSLLNQFVQIDLPSVPGIKSVELFLHNKPVKYHNINWFYPLETASPGGTKQADGIDRDAVTKVGHRTTGRTPKPKMGTS
ncbi:MAG: Lrp/AsnC family transcriptional regulator [Chloroflexota bacterium]